MRGQSKAAKGWNTCPWFNLKLHYRHTGTGRGSYPEGLTQLFTFTLHPFIQDMYWSNAGCRLSTLLEGTMAVSYLGIKPVNFMLQDQLLTHDATLPTMHIYEWEELFFYSHELGIRQQFWREESKKNRNRKWVTNIFTIYSKSKESPYK